MSDNVAAGEPAVDETRLHQLRADVRQAMCDDPLLEDEALWRLFADYANAIPDILWDMLDEPVTIANLFTAKARFLRYCAENGLGERLARVPGISPGMRAILLYEANCAEGQIERVQKHLSTTGRGELDYILCGSPRPSEALAAQLNTATATIAVLITVQPSMLMVNN